MTLPLLLQTKKVTIVTKKIPVIALQVTRYFSILQIRKRQRYRDKMHREQKGEKFYVIIYLKCALENTSLNSSLIAVDL